MNISNTTLITRQIAYLMLYQCWQSEYLKFALSLSPDKRCTAIGVIAISLSVHLLCTHPSSWSVGRTVVFSSANVRCAGGWKGGLSLKTWHLCGCSQLTCVQDTVWLSCVRPSGVRLSQLLETLTLQLLLGVTWPPHSVSPGRCCQGFFSRMADTHDIWSSIFRTDTCTQSQSGACGLTFQSDKQTNKAHSCSSLSVRYYNNRQTVCVLFLSISIWSHEVHVQCSNYLEGPVTVHLCRLVSEWRRRRVIRDQKHGSIYNESYAPCHAPLSPLSARNSARAEFEKDTRHSMPLPADDTAPSLAAVNVAHSAVAG